MIANKRVLAFIGARSGSKGLADKNIKKFNDKPLMAWTIRAALESSYVDKVVVSTNSAQYAEIAKEYGADVVDRPEKFATNRSSVTDALVHSLDELKKNSNEFNLIINLQITSPLRTTVHVNQALELFIHHYQFNHHLRVFSCYQLEQKYAWIMKCNDNGYANFIEQSERNKSNHARQNNPSILMPNGAIFILPANSLDKFYNEYSLPYIMPKQYSVDIDTLEDFDAAENIMKKISR